MKTPALDRAMNAVMTYDKLSDTVKRRAYPRIMALHILPLEILAILKQGIKIPYQTLSAVFKTQPWLAGKLIDSHAIHKFEKTLAGPSDVVKTAAKIVAFAIGIGSTITLGLIAPKINFSVHKSLGLIIDERDVAKVRALELQKKQFKEEAEKQLEEDIERYVSMI